MTDPPSTTGRASAEDAAAFAPVSGPARAVTLDALRGFAILGVVIANTLTFAYPQFAPPPDLPSLRGTGPLDRAVVLAVGLLVEGKFYTLLSVMFGMGLALQAERARATGRAFASFYLRRSAILFAIGVLHAVLLYSADILMFYALVAMVALPFHTLSVRGLTRAAGVGASLAIVTLTLFAATHPEQPLPALPDWSRLTRTAGPAAAPDPSRRPAGADPDFVVRGAASVLEALGTPPSSFYALMADERRIYGRGSFLEIARHRAIAALLVATPWKLAFLGFYALACFLGGMALARRRLLLRLEPDHLARCRRLLIAGVPLGLLLVIVASAMQVFVPRWPLLACPYWIGILGGTLLQGLGYAGGIVLLCARRPQGAVVRALSAVGRTALTNYLLQSVVLGWVFYSTGLGLFTRLTALPVVAMAFPLFALQAWLSTALLRRCAMGPVEWAWRCLTYGARLPLFR